MAVMRGDDRPESASRREILRAVISCVAENGIDGATIRRVAQTVGCSTGMIMHHFRSKRDMIAATIAEANSYSINRIDASMSGEFGPARLNAVVDLWVRHSDDLPPPSFWLWYWAEASIDPKLREMYVETSQRNRAFLERSIQAGIDQGEFRPDLDAHIAAEALSAIIQGLRVRVELAPGLTSAGQAAEVVQFLLSNLKKS